MVKIALQYILSYKEVSTVIPGVRNGRQLQENLSASQDLLSKEMIQALKGLWIENIKGHSLPW